MTGQGNELVFFVGLVTFHACSRVPDGKRTAVTSLHQAGTQSSAQHHRGSPSGEADAPRSSSSLLILLLCETNPPRSWESVASVAVPDFLMWPRMASGLFSVCLCRAFSVSCMEVNYILPWSQEGDSSLVCPSQSSVGTKITGGRRPTIFPVSEPQDQLFSPQ